MSSELRLLLDEHCPVRLADELTAAGVDTACVLGRAELRGADDRRVLVLQRRFGVS